MYGIIYIYIYIYKESPHTPIKFPTVVIVRHTYALLYLISKYINLSLS